MCTHHLEHTKFSINMNGLKFNFMALEGYQGFIHLRVSSGRL